MAEGALAGVLRDSSGLLLDAFAEKIKDCRPLVAVAKALVAGLRFLRAKEEIREAKPLVYVESDSLGVVRAVNGSPE